jgi:trigger factor
MKVEIQEVDACKRRLSVEAPTDVVQNAWEAAYGRVAREARLPGFRKGRVPRNLVKLHFADDVRREVAQHLIPEVYRQALVETRIQPVDEPDLDDVKLEEGAPLTFTATVEVKPVIEAHDYRGVAVQHTPSPITDADIENTLSEIRERQAEFRTVERSAAPGDLAIVDYTLTPEGLPPASQTGYGFVIGDGSVMAEIDEAVVGLSAGAEREVGVRFAQDHRNEQLRGKSGSARVKLVEVKEKVLPELDDELAKGLGEHQTLDELRAEVRRQLEARRAHENQRALEDKVVDALLAGHQFQVPEALVTRHMGHSVHRMREQMRRQGIDPDRVEWNRPELVQELRPGAERAVRRALLLDAIATAEGIAPGDADVDAEIARIAEQSQRQPAAVRGILEKNDELDGLRSRLREERTLELVVREAAVSPQQESPR